jgi:hypothetical protein
MTISNECLTIPPDHPLAKEFYDLQCIQSMCFSRLNPAFPHYDAAKVDEFEKALAMACDRIGVLQDQYRAERGGDTTCRVGLTYGANGFPLVDGRARNGTPFIEGGWLRLVPKEI